MRAQTSEEAHTPEAAMKLVSHALFVTLRFSMPYSFLPGCPKTWLETVTNDVA